MRASILSSVIAPTYGSSKTPGSRESLESRIDPGHHVVEHLVAFRLVEDLVIQAGIYLQLDVGGAHTFDQAAAAGDGDQPVVGTVHHQKRRGQRRRPLGHRLAYLQQGPPDAG